MKKNKSNSFALTIGNFDGVHLGHQNLLNRLLEISRDLDCTPLVITYQNHPKETFNTNLAPYLLNTAKQKLELLKQIGINHTVCLQFTREFAQQTPYEFLKNELIDKYKPEAIVLGYDTHFGKNRKGDFEFIKQHSNEFKYKAFHCKPFYFNNEIVSSSKIRNLLFNGNIYEANTLLGRHFSFRGVIVHGKKLGRTFGFPTINIEPNNRYQLIPAKGTYYTKTIIDGKEYSSLTNVGTNPTVSNNLVRKIESHILNFDQDVYGKEVDTKFIRKIRDEQKFSSVDDLIKTISENVKQVIRWSNAQYI